MATAKPKPAPPARPPPQLEVRSIEDLHFDAANVRSRDDETERMLEASLAQFKPFRSIAIDGDLITRAGNGTLKAAMAAGVKDVLIVTPAPGQLVAVKRDDLSPVQLTAYAIADNRLTDRSRFDDQSLPAILESLKNEGRDLASIGYATWEAAEIIGQLDAETRARGQADADADEEVTCPQCGHRFRPGAAVASGPDR